MPSKKSKLLIEYTDFLREQQGSAEATILIREKFVEPFLKSLGNIAHPSKLFELSAKTIHDYIIKTASSASRKQETFNIFHAELSQVFSH